MRRSPGWRRLALAAISLVLVVSIFYRWRHSRPTSDGTWARVQQTGVLRVGMDASYPPFSDAPSGTPVGLDVDLINEIGRRLHARIEITNMGFDGLYDSLYTGQVDVLISALSIDPAQLGRVMYTRNYIDAGQVIVSQDDKLRRMPDLEGRTVAVEYGSTGDEVARLWQRRLHRLDITHFTTPDEAMEAVGQGKADAALTDWVTARLYLRTHSGVSISPEWVTSDVYALAVRLSSYDLAGSINAALNDMERDGTLGAILRRWL
jgi:ABC-type amino acid transport substrate-binding protein